MNPHPMWRKPCRAGSYEVIVEGVFSLLPMWLEFDGVQWVGLQEFARDLFATPDKVFWYGEACP